MVAMILIIYIINMMKMFVFFACLSTMWQCRPKQYVHPIGKVAFDSLIRESRVLPRYDGLYNLYDTSKMQCGVSLPEHYLIYYPIVFLNDTLGQWENYLAYVNYDPLTIEYYHQKGWYFESKVGSYIVFDDTISAKLPITLYGGGKRPMTYEAYFQGFLLNRDTITGWKMIPPYPKANKRLNDDFSFLKTPHMLYFIESQELLGLDSLYNNHLKQGESHKR